MHGDVLYATTSNGIDGAHKRIVNPEAPSLIVLDKHTGKLVAQDQFGIGPDITHGQWSSPAVGVVDGKAQVYMPGGDGWLYAFDGISGDLVWKFDLNPKDSKWELGGRGTRNSIIATPVFKDNSVVSRKHPQPRSTQKHQRLSPPKIYFQGLGETKNH